jgi:hypothetical protein
MKSVVFAAALAVPLLAFSASAAGAQTWNGSRVYYGYGPLGWPGAPSWYGPPNYLGPLGWSRFISSDIYPTYGLPGYNYGPDKWMNRAGRNYSGGSY